MHVGNRTVRTWISLVLAVVFAIAAMPGSMAMPASTPMSHGMTAAPADCSGHGQCCDNMKAHQAPAKPCKNMAMCMGLLSCYGMGAVDSVVVAVAPMLRACVPVVVSHQSVTGLTHRPDNPPPIA